MGEIDVKRFVHVLIMNLNGTGDLDKDEDLDETEDSG